MEDPIVNLQNLKRTNQLRFLLFLHWLRLIDQPLLIPLKETVAVRIFMTLLLLVR